MEEINIFNTNSSPYLGIILAIISALPMILTYTIFKPKFKRLDIKKMEEKERIMFLVNKIIFIVNIILLVVKKDVFDIKTANVWFGIMCFFYILYYELYIRYIVRGRAQKQLYSQFMYVKVPLFISMSLSLVFAGIWSKDIFLIIVSILFAITNLHSSYKIYMKYFTEYRDLYDSNRKITGRKMLKDGYQPKGLKYVTVVVFIFNPKNKKWLMQKRTADKGGKWATTSGHPIAGQTSIQGMVTEIYEELGINVLEDELKFITTVDRKNKFADIYYLEKNIDIEKLNIQKEEVADVKWMNDKDIEAFYANKKFKKSHYDYYNIMKSLEKSNGVKV